MARKKQQRPRRKPNTGTIRYKQGRPLPWETQFPLGHHESRYDSHATWEEATAHLDRLVADRDNTDRPRDIAGGSQRLDRFLTSWLTERRPHLKDKTFENYSYLCDLAVGYFSADKRIDTITREDVVACYAYFAARDFKDVAQFRMVLGQAFEFALEEDYVKKNHFRRVKTPPIEHRVGAALTKAQRVTMLDVATVLDEWLAPLWHLYSRVGLRRGEGIGLLWGNINWEEKTISITQHYVHVGNDTVAGTPKTKRSRRTFPVPDDIMAMLAQLKKAQARRAANNRDWVNHGLVFTDAGGERVTVHHIRWRWTQIKKRAALPLDTRIHDLRHTALYHMEQAGVSLSVRMAFAGHATVKTANDYVNHAAEDMDAMRAALLKMG
jgi:integrase